MTAPLSSELIFTKTTCLKKIWQFNVSFDKFGWEITKLWKEFGKLLLSKKLFYIQTSEERIIELLDQGSQDP